VIGQASRSGCPATTLGSPHSDFWKRPRTKMVTKTARRRGSMAASAIAGQAAAIMISAASRLAMSGLVLRKFFFGAQTEVRDRQLARARAAGPPA